MFNSRKSLNICTESQGTLFQINTSYFIANIIQYTVTKWQNETFSL